jgi:hypothetical protein
MDQGPPNVYEERPGDPVSPTLCNKVPTIEDDKAIMEVLNRAVHEIKERTGMSLTITAIDPTESVYGSSIMGYQSPNKSYLRFEDAPTKTKTRFVRVESLHHGTHLGAIHWHAQWRQYCFFPYIDTVWSIGCMIEVQACIDHMMSLRKVGHP